MRLFDGQHKDITRAGDWTPELFGTMAIARTLEGVREKTQIAAIKALKMKGLDKEKLFEAWLYADGSIRFGLEDVIAFFGDNHKFSRVYGAINEALIFLCMRIQIENHRKRENVQTEIKRILGAKHAITKKERDYRTGQGRRKKAA